jgi:hypothetical protein
MSDKPCASCVHYDPIVIGGNRKEGRHGWCAVQSVYPAAEHPGQTFPDGVRRARPGELAKPHIVTGAGVVPLCVLRRDKP